MFSLNKKLIPIILSLCVSASFAQSASWWWQSPSAAATQNSTVSTAGGSATSNATGSSVQLHQNMSAQPPLVTIGSGSSPTLMGDLSVSITDGRTSIARGTATIYSLSITNSGSVARFVNVWAIIYSTTSSSNYPTLFSISCGATPSCVVAANELIRVTIPAGATVTVTRSATMSNLTPLADIKAEALVQAMDGLADPNPDNNYALDIQPIN